VVQQEVHKLGQGLQCGVVQFISNYLGKGGRGDGEGLLKTTGKFKERYVPSGVKKNQPRRLQSKEIIG